MSLAAGFLALLIVMPLCCFSPGLLVVRRFRWGRLETFAGAIGASGLLIYLFASAVYLSGVAWSACWGYVGLSAVATFLIRRDFQRLWQSSNIRRQIGAYASLVLIATAMLMVIAHYSGAEWAADWREHFERTDFFLNRNPPDMKFIGLYALAARPPMMNLVAAFFMAIAGDFFELYQFIFSALNLLVLLSCVPLSAHVVRLAPRRVGIVFAMLALNPLVMHNALFSWTKLYSAFYVLLAIAFYLRGLRKDDPRRLAFGAAMMCGAMLVHYSAGPFAVVIAGHYLITLRRRRRAFAEISSALAVTVVLLSSWFAWSIAGYGLTTTFASNTSVTGAEHLSFAENLLKIGWNVVNTIVPHPLHLSYRKFLLEFYQPNPFGVVRDYFFLLYQQNLPLSLGLAGWSMAAVLLWQFGRSNAKAIRFWVGLAIGVTLLGIASHGSPVEYGLTHVCLQPLALIGLTFLAAGLSKLPRSLRSVVVIVLALDAVLGIVLQLRMESLSFRMWPDIPGGASGEHGYQVVPYMRGTLNIFAMQNSTLRFQLGVHQFADPFAAIRLPLFVIIIGMLVCVLLILTRAMRISRIVTSVAVLVLIIGSTMALTDRSRGFDDVIPADLPAAPLLSAEEIETRIAPLRLAVQAAPQDVNLRYELGKAYYNLRQLDQAAETLGDAFLLDPSHRENRYLLQLLLRTHNRDIYQLPAGAAERYLHDPSSPLLQRNLARARAERNLPVH